MRGSPRQCQEDGIRRGELRKLGVVPAGGAGAVAAAHKEEVPDLPGPHCSHDLARVGEDGIPRKAGHDAASAVHAGHGMLR